MLCFRDHKTWNWGSAEEFVLGRSRLPANHQTLGGWLICAITDYWGYEGMLFMVRLGIWDAEEEGGVVFWRWDAWNAKMRRFTPPWDA